MGQMAREDAGNLQLGEFIVRTGFQRESNRMSRYEAEQVYYNLPFFLSFTLRGDLIRE